MATSSLVLRCNAGLSVLAEHRKRPQDQPTDITEQVFTDGTWVRHGWTLEQFLLCELKFWAGYPCLQKPPGDVDITVTHNSGKKAVYPFKVDATGIRVGESSGSWNLLESIFLFGSMLEDDASPMRSHRPAHRYLDPSKLPHQKFASLLAHIYFAIPNAGYKLDPDGRLYDPECDTHITDTYLHTWLTDCIRRHSTLCFRDSSPAQLDRIWAAFLSTAEKHRP